MSSHPQSSSYHRVQQPSIQPKRFNGFLGPSHSNSNSNSDQRQFQFNNLFGTQQQTTQAYQFSSSFTDDELIDSLIHHHHHQQQPTNNHHNSSDSNNCINHHQSATLTQPISFDQINLSHQPPANSNGAHHPIPIATSATSPDTERHASFSSSLPIEEHQLLLSPSSSSTHPSHAHSPSTISQLSSTHHTLRSSRSPQPKPLNNQHANYPFSPPTSITTTLVDEDRSPAISTISVCESTTQHSLSCSQPIGNTFYRPMTSADDSAVKSPIGRMSDELFLSTSLPTRRTFSPHAIIDQHKIILDEKRRKRRESHNAVERRRRDNINDRITELAELLPSSMLETVVTPNESGMMMVVNEEPSQTDDAQSLNPAPLTKPNKGVILAKFNRSITSSTCNICWNYSINGIPNWKLSSEGFARQQLNHTIPIYSRETV
ncbi:hypothetical protein VP01_3007g1 [Puccinia sorghi]|uniref:BHLH domain-containing protein n=1 Tax=Puccinia sorghi TaxID=27349 RepID=A0A0L6V0E1_9BASI|nr:hypothetical protein VP01_3007g1 [Puccinia sorghi]